MRVVAILMLLAAACAAADVFGTWEGKDITVRFEPHVHGEVFSLDTADGRGRATSSSTILYLDGKPRDFNEPRCTGTQSSRRIGAETVEIVRQCDSGDWIRFVRRLGLHSTELILEITGQHAGRREERRLVLKNKQSCKDEREKQCLETRRQFQ